ncbi:MAG: tRNA (adenosine(37)-N6)-threonylcarbamoyltransferase complex dimerization subunit type 1 TsaB [Burkholderiales bacterium]|nr:tRNA (adenosine(37)-N6)-threonylcarbamoyltransferase complex dimerization subunit type 1 TsaB [Burkholderiales bacterium]
MNLLALDCATEHCSVALWRDGMVDQRLEHAGQRHSELLLPMVTSVLRHAGLGARDLHAVAVTVGPGSFTGLRIGTAVAQGFAFGAGVPAVPVGTLEALAEGAGAERVLACIDARMNEIYAAAYVRLDVGIWRAALEPVVLPPEALELPAGAGWVGVGNAFARYAERLSAVRAQLDRVDGDAFPQARHVAAIAAALVRSGAAAAPDALVPVYVRDKVALTLAER